MSGKSKRDIWGEVAHIRAHPESKTALSLTKLRLRGSRLRFRGKSPSEEVVFNVLCLWAAAQDVGRLEAEFAPFLAHLEKIVAHGKAPEEPGGPLGGVTLVTKNRPPKGGSGAKKPSAGSVAQQPDRGSMAV